MMKPWLKPKHLLFLYDIMVKQKFFDPKMGKETHLGGKAGNAYSRRNQAFSRGLLGIFLFSICHICRNELIPVAHENKPKLATGRVLHTTYGDCIRRYKKSCPRS